MCSASRPGDLVVVRQLFLDCASGLGLGLDLGFLGFEDEIALLPGTYAPPRGRLLLAWNGDMAVGCVAP
jgi:hypothetical protein